MLDRIDGLKQYVISIFQQYGLDKDPIHGLRHFDRVNEEFSILCKYVSLSEQIRKCLNIAVIFHDIGRAEEGDHARASSEMFLNINNLLGLTEEERESINFAILNHSIGLMGLNIKKAQIFQEILLGLLVICDHNDAIGPEGFLRILLWSSKKHIPFFDTGEYSKEQIRIKMQRGFDPELASSKNASLIGHLLYNSLVTEHIIRGVQDLLTPQYIDYVYDKLYYTKAIIDVFLDN